MCDKNRLSFAFECGQNGFVSDFYGIFNANDLNLNQRQQQQQDFGCKLICRLRVSITNFELQLLCISFFLLVANNTISKR